MIKKERDELMKTHYKSKILKFSEPLTTAWPEICFLNSIIQTIETGYDWIMHTHIQMYGSVYVNEKYNINDRRVTFYPFGNHALKVNVYDLCPFFSKYEIPKRIVLEKFQTLSNLIVYCIDTGQYVSAVLDQFFRDDINNEVNRFFHPNYFYGYDLENKSFYIMDNFENGKFKSKIVSFDDVDKAYILNSRTDWEAGVFIYEPIEYTFNENIEFIRDQVKDYLESGTGMCYMNRFMCPSSVYKNDSESGEIFFGINSYNLLKKQIEESIQDERKTNIDIRSFSFLVDHKKLMQLRFDYLIGKGYVEGNTDITRLNDELVKKCTIVLNLLLKFKLSGNRSNLLTAFQYVEEIEKTDVQLMEYLYYQLENYEK